MNRFRCKGARGEREFCHKLREAGFTHAVRSRQFCGTPLSPDILTPGLAFAHFEVKFQNRSAPWNVDEWQAKAEREAGAEKIAIVAHRRSRRPWLVTMSLKDLLHILRFADVEALNHG